MSIVDRVEHLAPFEGSRSGTANLSWGQQWVWDALSKLPDSRHLCINIVVPIPANRSLSLEQVGEVVAGLVSRFESLRTTYVPDGEGGLRQHVQRTGRLPVDVRAVEVFDPDGADSLIADFYETGFEVDELPVRAVVVADRRGARLVALRFSHMAIDAWSRTILMGELNAALGLGDASSPVRSGSADWHPFDQAAYESTEEGRRACDRSLAFWRRQLHRFPDSLFPTSRRAPDTPPFCEARMESAAGGAAVDLLARRWRCSHQSVLMGTVVSLVAAWSDVSGVGLPMIVSNRLTRRAQGMVGPLAGMAPLYVDVAGRGLRDVVQATAQASAASIRHGQYEVARFDAMKQEVRDERAGAPDTSSFLNVRMHAPLAVAVTDDPAGEDAVARAARRTTVTWEAGFDSENVALGILADIWSDAVSLTLRTDTAILPKNEVAGILRAMDRVLIAAVRGETVEQDFVKRELREEG
ncbi:condensation domain-containing protein [Dactylosporangium sp. NPDC050688]|uniref:condensation domain-containing protein n=1 Tax=Dactylosporangium sp. NPDC050688 TaxID=3157217 RepID=UPI0033D09BFD